MSTFVIVLISPRKDIPLVTDILYQIRVLFTPICSWLVRVFNRFFSKEHISEWEMMHLAQSRHTTINSEDLYFSCYSSSTKLKKKIWLFSRENTFWEFGDKAKKITFCLRTGFQVCCCWEVNPTFALFSVVMTVLLSSVVQNQVLDKWNTAWGCWYTSIMDL